MYFAVSAKKQLMISTYGQYWLKSKHYCAQNMRENSISYSADMI